MKIRLLQTGFNSAYLNMAIDEAVLIHIQDRKSISTLRFYGWKPSAISIGYFQSLVDEINLLKCRELGVDYIRRITGGGAVFHEAEVTYSLIAPVGGDFIPQDILESYRKICAGIIEGLKIFKIKTQFVPLNDINIGQQKISGNAQTRKKGVLLQHGTILLDVDVDKMFSILQVPDEKIKDKLIKDVKERVTSISSLIGQKVTFQEVEKALIRGFKKALNLDYYDQGLIKSELELTKDLVKTKYKSEKWNRKR